MTQTMSPIPKSRAHSRESVRRKAAPMCAGHAQQLGGESPPANLMEVRPSDDARAIAARRGLKEAWNKRASRWTKTGYKAPAPDERATYREVRIHQGAKRRSGDGARKATELTPGDLLRVAPATEVSARRPDHGAEVSRGHSVC